MDLGTCSRNYKSRLKRHRKNNVGFADRARAVDRVDSVLVYWPAKGMYPGTARGKLSGSCSAAGTWTQNRIVMCAGGVWRYLTGLSECCSDHRLEFHVEKRLQVKRKARKQ